MVERILFPTDGSAGAMSTLEHALDLAVDHDASVDVLTVAGTDGDAPDREVLELAAERVEERGLSGETVLRTGRPYQEILSYAESIDVDLLVMPTHGRTGLQRLLLGSVTARVMRLSDTPVLTARPAAELRYPYRQVLVPTDGSRCAEAALEVGVDLAARAGTPLSVLSVVETTRRDANVRSSASRARVRDRGRSVVDTAVTQARERGHANVSGVVETGSSVPAVVKEYIAEKDVDLLVVGTHGRTGLDRYLFGGVTEQLVRTSPVPVLTVREPESAD